MENYENYIYLMLWIVINYYNEYYCTENVNHLIMPAFNNLCGMKTERNLVLLQCSSP